MHADMSAFGGKADMRISHRKCPLLTDFVEKVGSKSKFIEPSS